MRISDWSSDVCSSDLESRGGSGHLETLQLLRTTTGDIRSKFEIETNDGRHQPVRSPGKSRPILLLLCINRTAMMRVTTSLTDDGGTFSKDAAGRPLSPCKIWSGRRDSNPRPQPWQRQ